MSVLESIPAPELVKEVLSVCYRASLLREEDRPLRFRLVLRDADAFSSDQGPPAGVHRLLFEEMLPFTEQELRKLAPSVDFYGSLIGLKYAEGKGLAIWGILHVGLRWAQNMYGGGEMFRPLPDSLMVHVADPGRITVSRGIVEIASLSAGEIVYPSSGVFDSRWIRSAFETTWQEELALHLEGRKQATKPWATVDPEFYRMVIKQTFVRIVGKIRYKKHGGTLICIPDARKEEFLSENPYVKIKYKFIDEEPRRRFRTLIVELAASLAEYCGSSAEAGKTAGWMDYLACDNPALYRLDEALFELAQFIADMALVDGAVVFTRRFELIGFGAEISGKLDRAETIAHALDPEGLETRKVRDDCEGTRHHSAYNLCNALHDVLAVVISQDGPMKMVRWKDDAVTVWDRVFPSLIDI